MIRPLVFVLCSALVSCPAMAYDPTDRVYTWSRDGIGAVVLEVTNPRDGLIYLTFKEHSGAWWGYWTGGDVWLYNPDGPIFYHLGDSKPASSVIPE